MHPLHLKAISYAKNFLAAERQLLDVLMEMRQKSLFVELGYTGIYSYCLKALGLSESQACYFSQVARKSKEVPELKKAIDAGKLSVSKARRIVPVVNPENCSLWIEKAATLPQRELEREVAQQNPRSVQERVRAVSFDRHELKVGISRHLKIKLDRVLSLVSKQKRKATSYEEALEEMVDLYLKRQDPVEKAKMAAPSSRKEPGSASNQANPDVKPSMTVNPRNQGAIPVAIKHQVNLRDQGRCNYQDRKGHRCNQYWFTELHHKIPVSKGGEHSVQNLTTLCSGHHKMVHR